MKKNQINKYMMKRDNFCQLEKQNRILKILSNNTLLTKKKRTVFAQKRHNLKKFSSASIVRNTCIVTFRNRAIITAYKLSRFQFKKYASAGLIPGLRKV